MVRLGLGLRLVLGLGLWLGVRDRGIGGKVSVWVRVKVRYTARG